MYGLKRVEYGEYGHITAIEFHKDVSHDSIRRTMEELGLIRNVKSAMPPEKPTKRDGYVAVGEHKLPVVIVDDPK